MVIVDDHPVNLTVMEHPASRVDGATAPSLRFSERGLQYCRDHDFNLVIVDQQMPDIDEIQFIERMRATTRRLTDRAIELEQTVAKATGAMVQTERDTLLCLARAAEFRDPETGAHVLRMAEFSRTIAQAMGKDQDFTMSASSARPTRSC